MGTPLLVLVFLNLLFGEQVWTPNYLILVSDLKTNFENSDTWQEHNKYNIQTSNDP